jgi:hypothetical protein
MKNGVFWDVMPCGSCKNLQEPHGVTSQKTPFFIVTAVKTSNLTNSDYISNRFLCKKHMSPSMTMKSSNVDLLCQWIKTITMEDSRICQGCK